MDSTSATFPPLFSLRSQVSYFLSHKDTSTVKIIYPYGLPVRQETGFIIRHRMHFSCRTCWRPVDVFECGKKGTHLVKQNFLKMRGTSHPLSTAPPPGIRKDRLRNIPDVWRAYCVLGTAGGIARDTKPGSQVSPTCVVGGTTISTQFKAERAGS